MRVLTTVVNSEYFVAAFVLLEQFTMKLLPGMSHSPREIEFGERTVHGAG